MKTFILSLIFLLLTVSSRISAQGKEFHLVGENDVSGVSEKVFINGDETENNTKESNNLIVLDANHLMNYAWVLRDNGEVFFHYSRYGITRFSFDLPDGHYYFVIRFIDENLYERFTFYYTDAQIDGDATLTLDYSACNKFKTWKFFRKDSTRMLPSLRDFALTNTVLDKGIIYDLTYNYGTLPEYKLYFNEFPAEPFRLEYLVVGSDEFNGDYYDVNGIIPLSKDTLLTYNPDEYQHNLLKFYLSNPQMRYFSTYAFGINTFIGEYVLSNGNLPLEMSVYSNSDGNGDLLFSKKGFKVFYGYNAEHLLCWDNITTTSLFFKNGKTYCYFRRNEQNRFPLKGEELNLGYTPTFWYGKFENEFNKIKIKSPSGNIFDGEHLFLSQTNDVLDHFPIRMKITDSNGLFLIDEDVYPLYYDSHYRTSVGYQDTTLNTPVAGGRYKAIFINDKDYLLDSTSCTVTAISEFNTLAHDKNPPYLESFQILEDSIITHQLHSDKSCMVSFWPGDDNGLDTVRLYYRAFNGNAWEEIGLSREGNYYYGVVPELQSGLYSLKTYLTDASGNSMTMTQEPAFKYDYITDVGDEGSPFPDKFTLSQNYPNPFSKGSGGNPTTTINYTIPNTNVIASPSADGGSNLSNSKQNQQIASSLATLSPRNDAVNVTLTVYDILGRRVATLVNERKTPGDYSVKFSGNGLPSGIYFYTLRAGNFSTTKKMILMK